MKFPRTSTLIKLIIPAILLYALFMMLSSGEKRAEGEALLQELRQQAAILRQENEKLQSEIDSAQDDEVIANVARERFALVMPDEIVFYDPTK